jgi:hypothetical protein
MPNGVICDTRNLEAKGFGFIKPDAGKTCAGGIKGQILRLLYSCASTARSDVRSAIYITHTHRKCSLSLSLSLSLSRSLSLALSLALYLFSLTLSLSSL